MANQQENKEKTQTSPKKHYSKRGLSFNSMLALIAYIGIGCIALALILALIFKGNSHLPQAFNAVGQVIAYIICMILAYTWVKSHKQIAWIVCYVIFVVTIVVLFILTI